MNEFDPKFTPRAAALAVVGLKVADLRTDEALFDTIRTTIANTQHMEAQQAVACYVAFMRGMDYDAIVGHTGLVRSTCQIRVIEGMAILRTQEITRTVSAIRAGSLSKSVVDAATLTGEPEAMIVALEAAALAVHVKAKYVMADGGEVDIDDYAALVSQVTEVLEQASTPVTTHSMQRALPALTESLGITRKQDKRAPQVNTDGPFGIEYHVNALLADVAKIEAAADASYEPTPADMQALLRLAERFDLFDLSADDIDTLVGLDY